MWPKIKVPEEKRNELDLNPLNPLNASSALAKAKNMNRSLKTTTTEVERRFPTGSGERALMMGRRRGDESHIYSALPEKLETPHVVSYFFNERLGRLETGAPVGKRPIEPSTPTGLRLGTFSHHSGATPLGLAFLFITCPRVVPPTGQPWALGRNPFGIHRPTPANTGNRSPVANAVAGAPWPLNF